MLSRTSAMMRRVDSTWTLVIDGLGSNIIETFVTLRAFESVSLAHSVVHISGVDGLCDVAWRADSLTNIANDGYLSAAIHGAMSLSTLAARRSARSHVQLLVKGVVTAYGVDAAHSDVNRIAPVRLGRCVVGVSVLRRCLSRLNRRLLDGLDHERRWSNQRPRLLGSNLGQELSF